MISWFQSIGLAMRPLLLRNRSVICACCSARTARFTSRLAWCRSIVELLLFASAMRLRYSERAWVIDRIRFIKVASLGDGG